MKYLVCSSEQITAELNQTKHALLFASRCRRSHPLSPALQISSLYPPQQQPSHLPGELINPSRPSLSTLGRANWQQLKQPILSTRSRYANVPCSTPGSLLINGSQRAKRPRRMCIGAAAFLGTPATTSLPTLRWTLLLHREPAKPTGYTAESSDVVLNTKISVSRRLNDKNSLDLDKKCREF